MDPAALSSQISALDSSYNPIDSYNQITTQLGIPDARTRVQALSKNLVDTQNAIDAVDPNVTARTSGALVTEAQRGRLVNVEKQPLEDTYTKEGQDYTGATANLNDLTSQANTQQGLAADAYTTKRQSLADQLATAQKAQDDAEAKAESDRDFNEKVREANMSASSGSSAPLSQTQVVAAIKQGLESVKGSDNHVAPADLAKAYDDFTQSGLNPNDFWKYFQGYWNPNQGNYKDQFNAAR